MSCQARAAFMACDNGSQQLTDAILDYAFEARTPVNLLLAKNFLLDCPNRALITLEVTIMSEKRYSGNCRV